MLRRPATLALLLLLAACGQQSSSPPGSQEASQPSRPAETTYAEHRHGSPPAANGTGRVRYHVFQEIAAYGSELPGYGMYTYVLFPRKVPTDSELAERYRKLAEAIEASTMSPGEAEAAGFLPAESNLFCLPGGDASSRLVLSLKLFDHLRRSGAQARDRLPLDRPGPFLVSLPIPVRRISDEVPMLIADLSRTHVNAFPEIVAAYKQRLKVGGIDKVASFTSLRLSLLNLLLFANDDLSVIKVTLASSWSGL